MYRVIQQLLNNFLEAWVEKWEWLKKSQKIFKGLFCKAYHAWFFLLAPSRTMESYPGNESLSWANETGAVLQCTYWDMKVWWTRRPSFFLLLGIFAHFLPKIFLHRASKNASSCSMANTERGKQRDLILQYCKRRHTFFVVPLLLGHSVEANQVHTQLQDAVILRQSNKARNESYHCF